MNKQEKMTPLHFSLHLPPHFSGPLFRKILQKSSSLYLLSPIPLFASSLELAPLNFYLLLSTETNCYQVIIFLDLIASSQSSLIQTLSNIEPVGDTFSKNTSYSWLPGDPTLLLFSLCTGCCFSAFSSHWPLDLGPSGAQFLELSFSIYTASFGGLNYICWGL